MKKGFLTGNMLYDILIMTILISIFVILAVLFFTRFLKSFDRPPGETALAQSALYLWMIFKLRKLK